MKTEKCSSCGESFGCGANEKACWCQDLKVSKETLTALKGKFQNCLCQKCLKKYEDKNVQASARTSELK